jgi:pyrroline-5-carboxylate reductase
MAYTHLIIGAGNMGGALMAGWLKTGLLRPDNLIISDPTPGHDAQQAIDQGALHLSNLSDLPDTVSTVMLGIKPQLFSKLEKDLSKALDRDLMIISIMAGISSERLSQAFPNASIVRAMPNTPASIGKGINAYVSIPALSDAAVEKAEALLGSTGLVIAVETDEDINAVTAVSGSGPAYLFNFCEALTQAAQDAGLSPDIAEQLARQTLIGAAALLEQSDQTASALREAVTSPGGTTQAALNVLMAPDGLGPTVQKAVLAARDRSRELSA